MSLSPIPPFPSIKPSGAASIPNTPRGSDYPACDPLDPTCDNPFLPSPPITGGGGGGTTDVSVVVNIPPPAPITVNVPTTGITKAIQTAIDASTQDASQITGDLAQAIQGILGNQGTEFTNFLSVAQQLIVGTIASTIVQSFAPQAQILGAIQGDIQQLAPAIAQGEDAIISPILQTIIQLGVGINNSFASIGQGIDSGLANIGAQLNFLGTVDSQWLSQIAHWIELIAVYLPNHVDTTLGTGSLGQMSIDLKRVGDVLAGLAVYVGGATSVPHDVLTYGCNLLGTFNQLQSWLAAQDHLRYPFNEAWEWVKGLFANLALLIPSIGKYLENAQQQVDQSCPLGLLDPGLVAELLRRGILNSDDANKELALQGIAASRAKAIFDREAYLASANEVLEWFYRGAIDGNSVQAALTALGYNQAQIAAAQSAGSALLDQASLLTSWRFGLITDDELTTALKVYRYQDAQIQLLKTIAFRPPTPGEVLDQQARQPIVGAVSIPFLTGFFDIPQYYIDQGRKAGWDTKTIQANWANHWNLLSPGDWIQSYFRGFRTYNELSTALNSFMIPVTIQSDLVEASRPLIPFRTVPAMLKGGVLTIDSAKAILAKHGFTSSDIETLIAYAELAGKKTGTATAASAHQESLAVAKGLYQDGAINSEEYQQLLTAHGLTPDAVLLEIQLADLQDAIKARKTNASQIVDQFKAGMIDEPTAAQQIAQTGLTVGEQAHYLRELTAARSAKAKIPPEAELRKMAEKLIIPVAEYNSTLVQIGYTQHWADAYQALYFGTGPLAPPATTTTP